jgi:hypothetical protein
METPKPTISARPANIVRIHWRQISLANTASMPYCDSWASLWRNFTGTPFSMNFDPACLLLLTWPMKRGRDRTASRRVQGCSQVGAAPAAICFALTCASRSRPSETGSDT